MDKNDKVICQHADWTNAFGEPYTLKVGQRLTVRDTKRVGGLIFAEFKETPRGNWYWTDGFKPLRNLN